MWSQIVATIIVLLTQVSLAARILCVYNIPSISHQIVYRALTQELARRGHELVVMTPDPYLPKNRTADNVREIDVSHTYSIFKDGMANLASSVGSAVQDLHVIVFKYIHDAYDAQLESQEIKEIIHNKSEIFDLLIVEAVTRGPFFFTHRFKDIPVIGFNSLMGFQYNYEVMGVPNDPLVYSNIYQKKFVNQTIWDKAEAILIDWYERYAYWKSSAHENRIGKKHFGEDTPDIRKLVNNIDLLFLNVHPVWDGIRPVPPNVVYVGGLHIKKPKELPNELKNYVDGCKQGVIYMSLGTNIKSTELPSEKIEAFKKVFAELPYCVLWKWEDENMVEKPSNVRISKWLPQGDLLGHPNVLLFITQGGLQSTDEAIDREVPLIGIPFIADQEKNVMKYVHFGIGTAISIKELNYDLLKRDIETILRDESYRRNIAHLKRLMSDQPSSALERAVWWVEYVLRHGGARHLRSPSAAAPPGLQGFSYPALAVMLLAMLSLAVHLYGAVRAYSKASFYNKDKTE